jgi:hypothetical protein
MQEARSCGGGALRAGEAGLFAAEPARMAERMSKVFFACVTIDEDELRSLQEHPEKNIDRQ